ncbi:MAG: GNAT family N-acetyltransferase [Lachnospiraceae bacterium]|nr:GNAT family N-acetyltransferase [Lachnospiraceae bacterium]
MDEFEPVKKRVYLRDVKPDDRELLFQWVNDREVRANSFRQEQVSYREHCCWMERVLSDPDELFFLVMDDGNPVGQLRLTKCGGCAEISYSIAPD